MRDLAHAMQKVKQESQMRRNLQFTTIGFSAEPGKFQMAHQALMAAQCPAFGEWLRQVAPEGDWEGHMLKVKVDNCSPAALKGFLDITSHDNFPMWEGPSPKTVMELEIRIMYNKYM